jgi:thiamine transporter ThiT
MNRKHMVIAFSILLALAIILPLFNITLPFGNPNLGTTPVTLAAVYLPWYLGLITGLIKGISTAAITGRWLVEIPAGIGDALMACFTFWLARSMHKTIAAILGQLSRYIFTSGLIALTISTALAAGLINPSQAPVGGLTGTFLHNLIISWSGISYPSITVSILFNLVVSVLVILLFGNPIEKFLSAGNKPANQ